MFVLGDLINGKSLASLAESTRTALQNIAPQIQTTWFKQHDADGAHKDVTATRVRAGQLGLGGTFTANAGSAITCAPLAVPARVTVVAVVANAGATPINVYGIQQVGAQHGDILAVSMARTPGGSGGVNLHNRANGAAPGTTPVGTEITWDLAFSAVTPINLGAQSFRSPLLLMYLPETGSALASAWCVLRGLTP